MGHVNSVHALKRRSRRKNNSEPMPLFRWADGRRFINVPNTNYPLPSDEEESDRLSLQHFLLRFLWKGNFCSPVERKLRTNGRILDLGCGPGAWILEMASQYQRAQFIGVDVVPVFPTEVKPPNVTFVLSNALEKLPFKDGYFDFIHVGLMNLAFSEEQWKTKVLPEIIRVTKIGGWLEIEETDNNMTNPPPILEPILDAWIENLENLGINPYIATQDLDHILAATGNFDDINHRIEILPFTERIGRAGEISKDNAILFYRTVAPMVTKLARISEDEYENTLRNLSSAFEKCESYHNMHRIFSQKVSD
ncbi:hypothetical protein G9A89_004402 [Geosiphon pyriformis]|nr:hypothetical protein G9A89_004402 [Geosiphon pyriformis]